MNQPNTPWVYVKPMDITIGVPPKNGSTSVYDALRRTYDSTAPISGAQWIMSSDSCEFVAQPKGLHAFFIVRHPVDRFRSLWVNKCLRAQGKADADVELAGLTPDELLQLIRHDPEGDPHWRSQLSLLGNPEMAIELVPIEHLSGALPLSVWRMNDSNSAHFKLDDRLVAQVKNHYAGDCNLYQSARYRYEDVD